MQAKFVQSGDAIDYTPSGNVAAGQVVVGGSGFVTVAKRDIAAGQLGALAVKDVFDFAKVNDEVAFGDPLFWDADGDPVGGTAGTGAVTTDDTKGPFCGYAVAAAGASAATVRVSLRSLADASAYIPAPVAEHIVLIPIEDLGAGDDIAARIVFAHPRAGTLISAALIAQGNFAGIDASNTMVVALKDGAGNTIVTKTYNNVTVPDNADVNDLGALSGTHKVLTADELVTLDVTNGSTANPPAMLLRLIFRPASEE